jgi:NADPH-dependent 2,4-dienoyl-CoA reductase/sulfur reductase-like enzyme
MVIVGGGETGGTAAATLRDEGFDGPVMLISGEPGIPVGRPPLSKSYLRSEENLEGWYVSPADWYGAHDVDLRTESVVAVDPAAHTLVLESGEELEYQKVLLATGGRNRQLRIPGAELPGIYYLRTVADCDAIKREAMAGILVDEQCRTSAEDVYAAGDVANHLHPVLGRVRVEHYNSSQHHGAAAARSMLGSAAPFDYIHNFWTDQYEHTLQYVGHATTWDDFAIRGGLEDGRLVGFYLLAGRVQAAVGFDRGGDPEWDRDSEMAASALLVASRAQPDRGALTDERGNLWSLAR